MSLCDMAENCVLSDLWWNLTWLFVILPSWKLAVLSLKTMAKLWLKLNNVNILAPPFRTVYQNSWWITQNVAALSRCDSLMAIVRLSLPCAWRGVKSISQTSLKSSKHPRFSFIPDGAEVFILNIPKFTNHFEMVNVFSSLRTEKLVFSLLLNMKSFTIISYKFLTSLPVFVWCFLLVPFKRYFSNNITDFYIANRISSSGNAMWKLFFTTIFL